MYETRQVESIEKEYQQTFAEDIVTSSHNPSGFHLMPLLPILTSCLMVALLTQRHETSWSRWHPYTCNLEVIGELMSHDENLGSREMEPADDFLIILPQWMIRRGSPFYDLPKHGSTEIKQ